MPANASFFQALSEFAEALTRNFASLTAAQPEDQLKTPLQNLLAALADAQGHQLVTRTEAQVREVRGRPDIGVDVDGLLTGHIELKAPGLGANPQRFRDEHSKRQWQKFKALPNLIYTDGNEWILYRSGERVARAEFHGDVTRDGAEAFTETNAERLERLLQDFLLWQPVVPANPKALAELLAPLCRMVRDDVMTVLPESSSNLAHLARDWREVLFPDADDAKFADAYAQTLTYALLLARFSGAASAEPELAARALDSGHGLLAGALRLLGNPDVRSEVGVGLEVLIRAINAVDPVALMDEGDDPWLYFYEDFLAAYDRKLRNDYGVYYTPAQVIQAQVRLVAEQLEAHFDKALSFADDGVVVLDPAAGTGAYPLSILQHALSQVADFYGGGLRSQYATKLAKNVHAFEFLVGPYAVAHLRITQKILDEGGALPDDGVHVYLADTLESPNARDLEEHGMIYRRLSDEHKRARRVKNTVPVLVCIGNPPYDRQQRDEADREHGTELKGGWVRFGEQNLNNQTNGILKAFTEPAIEAGQGGHIKNLYNDYVYFWRWALWKVFEQVQGPGMISFITAASYLRGPGFVGMREHMRRTLDELWIIDLEGDSLGARKTENVFAIRTPVAIAMGVRYGAPKPDEPATIHYARIKGTRGAKLEQLAQIERLSDLEWRECPTDWQAPFLPVGVGDYYSWPLLTDIFPWQHSGVQFKRTWPIAGTKEVLEHRWQALMAAPAARRAELFRETAARKVEGIYASLEGSRLPALSTLTLESDMPAITRYGYRSFDRQWTFEDTRFADRMRNDLWHIRSPKQVYLTSLLTGVLGLGPAATVSAFPTDMDHFRGSFGAKHVIPLWRNAKATEPNITSGLLDVFSEQLGEAVTPEDLLAYAYAVLASPSYVERFSEELTLPGPRLPITKDAALFREMAVLGRKLIGWHTYGERLDGSIPRGEVRNTVAVPTSADAYPNVYRYDPQTRTLHVGKGEFAPVAPEVWGFSVSGLEVVKSWLGYRMREAAGRSSSPLDEIRPSSWSADMTRELLELLWVLEATVALWPELAEKLEAVISGPVFSAAKVPQPSVAERSAPVVGSSAQTLFEF